MGVTAGELSPIVTGLVYCNTIGFWQSVYELRRAREWTEALTRWCEQQPDMVAHTGVCLVHRAELMQLQGAWDAALEEARRAGERSADGVLNERVCGKAYYRQGEVHRLRGERGAAEESYREASRRGYEPQPGLALLRLAEGKGRRCILSDPAGSRRGLAAARARGTASRLRRDHARRSARSRRRAAPVASSRRSRELTGATCSGDVRPGTRSAGAGRGRPRAALVALREAWQAWQELEAPYEAARVRVLVGLGCRAVGDEDAAAGSWTPPAACSHGWGRLRTSRGWTRCGEPQRSRCTWTHAARAAGATPRRPGRDEQVDRRRARAQRADDRPAREQRLREAAGLLSRRGHRVRLRARPRLTLQVGRSTHAAS